MTMMLAATDSDFPINLLPLTLQWPPTLRLAVTIDQFEALVLANGELRLERTAQGELIVNPPTGWETGKRNRSLTGQLDRWYEEHPELGEAFDSSTGFRLANGAIRSPDSSWVSAARWNALTETEKGTFPQICPDFVVELRSASDGLLPLQEKMQEYLANGARLGWLIDPQNRRVEVYRADRPLEILENPRQLSGEAVLRGFVVDLQKLWG